VATATAATAATQDMLRLIVPDFGDRRGRAAHARRQFPRDGLRKLYGGYIWIRIARRCYLSY